ncbi:response regulator transcription factor [Leifsonia lichenia]
MTPVRLLVVDDHPVVRDGIVGMVSSDQDIEVVGEASDGAEAVRLARSLQPDVVLMDLRMPGTDGVSAIRELRRLGVPSRIVVLTTYDSDADVLPAIEAGATGYLLKDVPRDDLVRAVHAAANGHSSLAPSVASRLVDRVRTPEASLLTPRELQVLALVADGATNREAGVGMHVSEATVKTHLLSVYGKLGVGDRAAAVAEGFRRGLL